MIGHVEEECRECLLNQVPPLPSAAMLEHGAMLNTDFSESDARASCRQACLWLVGNRGMGYNCNYYYYHSSIPY